jgi:hypothetical protein
MFVPPQAGLPRPERKYSCKIFIQAPDELLDELPKLGVFLAPWGCDGSSGFYLETTRAVIPVARFGDRASPAHGSRDPESLMWYARSSRLNAFDEGEPKAGRCLQPVSS